LIQSLNSKKPNFRSIALRVKTWKHQGFQEDPRVAQHERFQGLEFQDIVKFYQNYIKKDVVTIAIVGDKRKIDMEKLAKFGTVIEVSKKDIFN
jgi:predicted Zn-dependent peptidase